jgi:hypothetical protein
MDQDRVPPATSSRNIRSIHDSAYTPAHDPFRTPASPTDATRPQSVPARITPALEAPIRSVKLPDTKDFPIFEGYDNEKSSVADDFSVVKKLNMFFIKLEMMKESRHINDAQIIERFSSILKNDAFLLFHALWQSSDYSQEEGPPHLWSIQAWHQKFLNNYASETYIASLQRAHAAWKFPSSESNAYRWATRFYELSTQLNPALSPLEFRVMLCNHVDVDLSILLRKEYAVRQSKTAVELITLFSTLVEQQDVQFDRFKKRLGQNKSNNREHRDRDRSTRESDSKASTLRSQDRSKDNHRVAFGPSRTIPPAPAGSSDQVECYKCHSFGHISKYCPLNEKSKNARNAAAAMVAALDEFVTADETSSQSSNEEEQTPATGTNSIPLGTDQGTVGVIDHTTSWYDAHDSDSDA